MNCAYCYSAATRFDAQTPGSVYVRERCDAEQCEHNLFKPGAAEKTLPKAHHAHRFRRLRRVKLVAATIFGLHLATVG